jgi:hypothetical protein
MQGPCLDGAEAPIADALMRSKLSPRGTVFPQAQFGAQFPPPLELGVVALELIDR